jgi:hypothetical protein
MKYFITFALICIAAVVLIHVISKLLGLGEPRDVGTWAPVAFCISIFMGLSIHSLNQKKQSERLSQSKGKCHAPR